MSSSRFVAFHFLSACRFSLFTSTSLVVLCVGVQGSTVAMRDCVRCLGGVMDKARCIFFYMVMLCLGVHGPAKSWWAGYLQKLLVQKIFGTEVNGSEAIEHSCLEANVVQLTGVLVQLSGSYCGQLSGGIAGILGQLHGAIV